MDSLAALLPSFIVDFFKDKGISIQKYRASLSTG
jgi:hypothetical protein